MWCGLGLCAAGRAAAEEDAMLLSCGPQPAVAVMATTTMAAGRMVRGRNSLVIGSFPSIGLLGR